jgi:hypothetical protein
MQYAPNPRKNDGVVDQMVGPIREFGFRIPIVAESDGSVVDGHLRLKAARKQQAELEFAEPGEREVEAERVQVAEFERQKLVIPFRPRGGAICDQPESFDLRIGPARATGTSVSPSLRAALSLRCPSTTEPSDLATIGIRNPNSRIAVAI